MKLPAGFRLKHTPIGMRTVKTALAVTLSLMVIEYYGASPAKVVFATIGAISAVGPTFTASLLACATQICGVSVGALLALTLMALHVPSIVGVGIGIMLIITSYHHLKLKLVPVLPCLVLVNICLNPEVEALSYSLGRIWDTAIGLAIGMLVNTLIFPYDNSRKIRRMMEGLDGDLICILEDLFDGDDHLPKADDLGEKSTRWRVSWPCFPSSVCCGASGRSGNPATDHLRGHCPGAAGGAGGPVRHAHYGPPEPGKPPGSAGPGGKGEPGGAWRLRDHRGRGVKLPCVPGAEAAAEAERPIGRPPALKA